MNVAFQVFSLFMYLQIVFSCFIIIFRFAFLFLFFPFLDCSFHILCFLFGMGHCRCSLGVIELQSSLRPDGRVWESRVRSLDLHGKHRTRSWETQRDREPPLAFAAPHHPHPENFGYVCAPFLSFAHPLDCVAGKDIGNLCTSEEFLGCWDADKVGCIVDVPVGLCSQDV